MSQRERLLGRRIPPTPVRIRLDYTTPGVDALFGYLAQARAAPDAATDGGRQRVEAAQAACDPYCEILHVVAVAPDRYDALISEHPPTDANRALGHQWDPATFVPALLAACIGQDADDPMTESDWSQWMRLPGVAASGEVSVLFQTCLTANDRSPDVQVGKG